jgi:excisionase family DNA binding protein
MLFKLDRKALLTSLQAAEYLGISDSMVRRYCRKGAIPAVKAGKTWIIADYDLKHFSPTPHGRPWPKKKLKK